MRLLISCRVSAADDEVKRHAVAVITFLPPRLFIFSDGNHEARIDLALSCTLVSAQGWWRVGRLFRWRLRKFVVSHRQERFLPPVGGGTTIVVSSGRCSVVFASGCACWAWWKPPDDLQSPR
ncbi:hypothetical protein MRX96_002230 [Rhipicephalus microplus]